MNKIDWTILGIWFIVFSAIILAAFFFHPAWLLLILLASFGLPHPKSILNKENESNRLD
jgi:hypothetical protein